MLVLFSESFTTSALATVFDTSLLIPFPQTTILFAQLSAIHTQWVTLMFCKYRCNDRCRQCIVAMMTLIITNDCSVRTLMYSLFHKRCVCIMPITNKCQMFPWGYVSFAINVLIIQLLMEVPCVNYNNNCVPFNYLFTRMILFKEESWFSFIQKGTIMSIC